MVLPLGEGKNIAIRAIVLAVIIIHHTAVQSMFKFTSQPQDMTVSEGEDTRFSCTFEGSVIVPTWRISGLLYTWSSLPDHHTFDGERIVIQNVDLTMNGNTYQCLIPGVAQSTVGLLTVLVRKTMYMYTTNSMSPYIIINSSDAAAGNMIWYKINVH